MEKWRKDEVEQSKFFRRKVDKVCTVFTYLQTFVNLNIIFFSVDHKAFDVNLTKLLVSIFGTSFPLLFYYTLSWAY